MVDSLALRVTKALAEASPGKVLGVAIDDPQDKRSWRIDFDKDATPAEVAAAEAALASFDRLAPAKEEREPAELLGLLTRAQLAAVIDDWVTRGVLPPGSKAALLGRLKPAS